MRVPNYLENRRFSFNMTPMIDVVFLMIIFFLAHIELDSQEQGMPLDLSLGVTGAAQADEKQRRLTINVDEEGRVFVMGDELTKAQLTQIVEERFAEFGEDLEVRIRASRKVPYGRVNPVMIACTDSGVWNVKYAIVRPEGAAQ